MVRTWLYRAYCAGVLAFLLVPIAAIVPLSFSSGSFLTYPLPGLSLRWYGEVLGGGKWLTALGNSLFVGTVATLAAVSLGTLAALGLARRRGPLVAALEVLDPNLARAAAACGATPATAFRRVTLPAMIPAMASGALFA